MGGVDVIFVDVGAHEGQTLEEVVKPSYGFSHIHAYEPMTEQWLRANFLYGSYDNVTVHHYGLAYDDGNKPVYGTNKAMDATLFQEKRDTPDPAYVTVCRFQSAARVFASFPDEPLIVKLNCEGAEIEILDSLIDSGQIHRVENVMIDFDIRKVTGHEHEEQRIIRKLAATGFDRYSLCEEVMRGATHQERIASWLRKVGV